VKVVCDRLERFSPASDAQRPDASFIRAVAGLGGLVDALRGVASAGGRWIYYLGAATSAERLRESLRGTEAFESEGLFGGRLLWGSLERSQPS
jgi:16S rRNA G527 N7-methylase RsmG